MGNRLEKRKIHAFQKKVSDYYRENSRALPWRTKQTTPYHVLVSEIMLQQTQAHRVIPKYTMFIQRFPTVHVLAHASLTDVLTLWQGLGYNRRAKALHETAKIMVKDFGGHVPNDRDALESLPGIGPYTAGAVLAFGFNKPEVFIETNIRTVFLHHFFKGRTEVHDREILSFVEQTLDRGNPRAWYEALMDYGAHLKQIYANENVRSRHYVKQGAFEGSNRQLRGKILSVVLKKGSLTYRQVARETGRSTVDVRNQLDKLLQEGLLQRDKWYVKTP